MRITITVRNNDGSVIDEQEFTQDKSKPFSSFNIDNTSISSLILLAIRYLSQLGPY